MDCGIGHPRRHAFRAGNAEIMRVSLNSRYIRAADVADIVEAVQKNDRVHRCNAGAQGVLSWRR
jgi:hypothetical protein